jgi:hypothetical protein
MKRLILILTAVLSLCTANKTMAYDFSAVNNGDTIYYNYTSATTVEVTSTSTIYNSYSGAVVIPSTVTDGSSTYSVTVIGDGAFSSCSGLTSVSIPNSVTTIGDYAFIYCSGLTGTLTIPNSVTTIGNRAFANCSGLTGTLTIPISVTTIGERAFYACSGLTGTLTIPNSVTTIGERAFSSCSGLTSITIPNSVTIIGNYAFSYCDGLTTITIPNSVTTIGNAAFRFCVGLTSLTIPNSVTTIGDEAFASCIGLTEMYIKAVNPPSLGYDAFYRLPTNIPIHVPCGNATAYQSASGWSNFSNIIGDASQFDIIVQSNDNTMGSASITQRNTCTNSTAIITATANQRHQFIQWNDGDTSNPRVISVTKDTSFTAIFISSVFSAVNNGDTIFYNIISATTVEVTYNKGDGSEYSGNIVIPNTPVKDGITYNVTSIGNYAFWHCSGLTGVMLPNSVMFIGYYAFSYCSGLTGTLTIPNSVNTIGYWAFEGCIGLTSITIPNSVTNIGNAAFVDCSGLTSISVDVNNTTYSSNNGVLFNKSQTKLICYPASKTGNYIIPNSVTTIGDYAFYYCDSITEMYVKAVNPPLLGYDAFYAVLTTIPVHVPCGSITAYQSASGWNNFTNIIDDLSPLNIAVQSNDNLMGVANIIRMNTCTNDTAMIEVVPNHGYRFVHWNDGDTTNPRIITVTMDTTFTATFEAIMYHVAVTSNDLTMGTVIGDGYYAGNTVISIEAISNSGYRFVQWHDGITDNPRTITVISDTSFTAEFEPSPLYHLTLSVNNTNMGTVIGDGDYI